MTRAFLVFQLYGPMAAWGEPAVGEVRPTENRPSRSALLGILAASLGLRREDDTRQAALGASLAFGVSIEAVGVPLSDYHTIQLGKPRRSAPAMTRQDQLSGPRHELTTLLSERHYRCDAEYRVAAWGSGSPGPWSLDELRNALERPIFTPYLGRKSCPLALPLAPKIVEAETLAEAFSGYTRPLGRHPPTPAARRQALAWLCWEGEESIGGVSVSRRGVRRDDPLSRRRWTFGRRDEFHGVLAGER